MNRYVFLVAVAATLIAGCSTNRPPSTATDDDEKVVVTGSRIPRSDRSATGVTSTNDSNAIHDMMKPNPGAGVPGR